MEEPENKKPVGRPRKYIKKPADVLIRKSIAIALEKYFTSDMYQEDMALGKSGEKRMQLHLNLLPYVITKKESIKKMLSGLDEEETEALVQRLKEEIK
ncbi:hypothetical protein MWU58_09565 [Flavobacteriaceae bacterium S0825]|uniref:hypothetical protein n=1 Tax=Gaetbulibacter sp. S0825 TaxID=2720084 RepID=UPI001431C9A4|nr:hypothetical protein [Gaetbulibacter sp. S0825]MCK0109541.1 hypothetical protein [Flavobacteriaceae bacterium S0825]NIX65174.1 hypothetical protein [Gaetbulibacter sp. S0825]